MFNRVAHIGLTVKDIDRSLKFYTEILGFHPAGELEMQGKETDKLFKMKNCKIRVAYLKVKEELSYPTIELIQFLNHDIEIRENKLTSTSISELCFEVEDIDGIYQKLLNNRVECLSEPQTFDFLEYGFSKSKAIYFKDPDGIILELIENIK